MKTDYRNWVSKNMIYGVAIGTIVTFTGMLVIGILGIAAGGFLRVILGVLFGILFVALLFYTTWAIYAHNAFSYKGKRKLSKQIIEGIADYVTLPENGVGLDIGCGSGALTIACAKRNPKGAMVGTDRWGKEWGDFNLELCQNNAKAEGITNVSFRKGDAINLPFDDESYDAVTSNYVYHNISVKGKQELLLETLRVLKKGGTFAIHDLMSPMRYGDMEEFVLKLKEQGYEDVRLIDTAQGLFMDEREAKRLMLKSSTLLVGRK